MQTFLITLLNIVFWLFMFYGVADIIVRLPEDFQNKAFDFRRKFYHVSEREMRFYRKIGIKSWKGKLPQHNTDFDKSHLPDVVDVPYLKKYIFITCRAEIIHYAIAILGFLSVLFCLWEERLFFWRRVYTLIAAVIALGHTPFILVQRYNRYRLVRLLRRKERCAE